MLRRILEYPDPRLAQKSKPIEEINDTVRAIATDMLDTLKHVGGVGLAAPQIGELIRMVIIDVSLEEENPATQNFKVFLNPTITVLDSKVHAENEGCLSVIDLRADVNRPSCVAIDATDLDGQPLHFEGTGYFSACMQHECEHLDGKVFVDHLSFLKKSMYLKKINKAKKS